MVREWASQTDSHLKQLTNLHDPSAAVALGGELAGPQTVAEGVHDLKHVVLVGQEVLSQRLLGFELPRRQGEWSVFLDVPETLVD